MRIVLEPGNTDIMPITPSADTWSFKAQVRHTVQGHGVGERVTVLSTSRNKGYFVSGSSDAFVKLWRVRSFADEFVNAATYEAHSNPVLDVRLLEQTMKVTMSFSRLSL